MQKVKCNLEYVKYTRTPHNIKSLTGAKNTSHQIKNGCAPHISSRCRYLKKAIYINFLVLLLTRSAIQPNIQPFLSQGPVAQTYLILNHSIVR